MTCLICGYFESENLKFNVDGICCGSRLDTFKGFGVLRYRYVNDNFYVNHFLKNATDALDAECWLRRMLRRGAVANNLPVNGKVMSDTSNVFCYFARMVDGKKRRLTATGRATAFKGILKSRLVQFTSDALKLVPDKVFKLDNDFDLVADDDGVSILRPSGFEFVGQLKEAILAAAPSNVKLIQTDLPFVDFAPIAQYASKHPRAARYIASIRGQKEARNVDKASLLKLCENTGVKVQEVKGKLIIEDASVFVEATAPNERWLKNFQRLAARHGLAYVKGVSPEQGKE